MRRMWHVRYVTDSRCYNDLSTPSTKWGASVPFYGVSWGMIRLALRMWWRGYIVTVETY